MLRHEAHQSHKMRFVPQHILYLSIRRIEDIIYLRTYILFPFTAIVLSIVAYFYAPICLSVGKWIAVIRGTHDRLGTCGMYCGGSGIKCDLLFGQRACCFIHFNDDGINLMCSCSDAFVKLSISKPYCVGSRCWYDAQYIIDCTYSGVIRHRH